MLQIRYCVDLRNKTSAVNHTTSSLKTPLAADSWFTCVKLLLENINNWSRQSLFFAYIIIRFVIRMIKNILVVCNPFCSACFPTLMKIKTNQPLTSIYSITEVSGELCRFFFIHYSKILLNHSHKVTSYILLAKVFFWGGN